MSAKNKGIVYEKDNPLNKIEIGDFTSNLNFLPEEKQTLLCSFCRRELFDDSIRFRGISVCPNCLSKWLKLVLDFLEYDQKREARYGIK